MNPMDPKITHAIKAIEAAYAGQEAAHGYYDHAKKVYVLVVSGDEADTYHNAVKAIHDLGMKARQLATKKHP
jgi:hypothetical protein